MAATVGFQYRKTLEDILREGDPTIPLRFDNHAGIQAINSVFYRRNQEEMDDGADALVLEQYKLLQRRRQAGNMGMSEDQARMLEDRRAPRTLVAPMPPRVQEAAEAIPAGSYDDMDVDDPPPGDPTHSVVLQAVAEFHETHTARVSRTARFAQVVGEGVGAASGAAESMINHTASAIRLIPSASATIGREVATEAGIWGSNIAGVARFMGPGGPPAGLAAQALITGAHQASRNQQEYNGMLSSAWHAAAPVTNALNKWLLGTRGPPPSFLGPAPEGLPDFSFGTAPSSSSSSSAAPAAIGDWDTHIFGPRAGLPVAQSSPMALMPPPNRQTRSKAAAAPPPRRIPPHARSKAPPPKASTPYGAT